MKMEEEEEVKAERDNYNDVLEQVKIIPSNKQIYAVKYTSEDGRTFIHFWDYYGQSWNVYL